MEIHILDANFRRIKVVDSFISFIWAERFSDLGDFELTTKATPEMRGAFPNDTFITIPKSYRVMQVTSVLDSVSDDGEMILKITGTSIEDIMNQRVGSNGLTGLGVMTPWTVTGYPMEVARNLFLQFCSTGSLSTLDKIPFFSTASYLPTGNNPVDHESTEFAFEPDVLHTLIQGMCKQYNMGYRLVRKDGPTPSIHFDIYVGDNRTTGQTIFPGVIFDQKLENFGDVSELNTIDKYKNTAYVFGNKGAITVYADGVDETAPGFKRRIMIVKANDITLPVGQALTEALTKKGKEELAKNRATAALDGEISQFSQYTYGVDYNLGDIVETRGSSGISNQMRITEQIFVSDEEGDRSYPTMVLERVITPGSWDSVPGNLTWHDVDPSKTWSNY